ncbi:uncharacterized protein LOC111018299 isoform X2 [Momordica charantia]|nr:uncharacterized protein LOC111018299 isoform X2 [Momordica charantia]
MLGARADDQVPRPNDVDNKKEHLDEQLDFLASLTKEADSVWCPPKSVLRPETEILVEDLCVPECESKKRKGRKRNSSKIDKAENTDDPEVVPAKKSNRLGRKPLDSSLKKRKRLKKSGSGSNLDVEVQLQGDDDTELTVEDLMVIAKEYVEADEDRAGKHKLYGEPESSSLNQTTSYTRNQSDGSFITNNDSEQSSLNFKPAVSCDSTVISDCEKVDVGVRRTGDPAKDMLDLFLGPLLKKSSDNEQSKFVTKDIQFACDLKSQSQSQRHNDNVGEVVSVMKKKSSLKDKEHWTTRWLI